MVKRLCTLATALLMAALFALPFSAHAAVSGPVGEAIDVEQVQVELPDLRAYFYMEDTYSDDTVVAATLGRQALESVDVRLYDPAVDSTAYFFLVDCSTSTTYGQMAAVKTALNEFAAGMNATDTMTLITFGVDVATVLDRETNPSAITAAVDALVPDQAGTVFFDALAAAIKLSAREDTALQRKLAFVFSDSVDYNLGSHTKDEIDKMLAATGLPFYGLGFSTGTKEGLDNFAAITRASGGSFSAVNEGNLAASLASWLGMTSRPCIATFKAPTNVITAAQQSFTLTVGSTTDEMLVPVRFWQPDTTAPTVLEITQPTAESLRIQFSEAVQGAQSADSFTIQNENGDLIGIRAAAYDEESHSATLTLSEVPPSGALSVACPGITDISMEQNKAAGATSFGFEGRTEDAPAISVAAPAEEGPPMVLWLVVTIAAMAIIAAIVLAVIKKRGGLTVKDNKVHFAGAVQVEQQVASGPEVQVHFVSTALPQIRLHVTGAGGDSRVVEVPINKTLFVGRADLCDLVFDDASMSRQHFVIGEENGLYTLTNLSETSGTLLNGVPVQKPRPLQDGDTISAGQASIVFFTIPPNGGPPA